MTSDLKNITIYTDGACLGNPGPGGYGAVFLYGQVRREMSGGFRRTTNNRMEIMAAIVGMEALKEKCQVTLYSDSQYLVKAIAEGWARRWRANRWMRNKTDRAVNPDLWAKLLKLCETHEVEFKWVRGHSSNAENIRCDELAVEAANSPNLPVDQGYEGAPGKAQAGLL